MNCAAVTFQRLRYPDLGCLPYGPEGKEQYGPSVALGVGRLTLALWISNQYCRPAFLVGLQDQERMGQRHPRGVSTIPVRTVDEEPLATLPIFVSKSSAARV